VIAGPGELLRRHGLAARKQWGQNFLHDPRILAAIVAASRVGPGDRVVEIGAGLGTLTAALLATGAEVWAIERDRDMCHVLRAELGDAERFRLWEADAVRFDYAAAARHDRDPEQSKPVIVGNLPYHLTAPLLFALLAQHEHTGAWIVMVQKEVADRMCAPPGNKTYGGMTVVLSRLRSVRRVIAVPPGAFLPPPRVESAVVRLDPLEQPRAEVADPASFSKLVRTAFSQRRKTLANALAPLADKAAAERWCAQAGIDSGVRPERLSVEEFGALERAREQESTAGDDA
jgi:16S rRNA (adenine1518-N6/adenine1519-N6)-dimethyltransferase